MVLIVEEYTHMADNLLFWLYIAGLVTDIITGNIKAWTTDDVDSKTAVDGSLKHFALLAMVVILLPTLNVYIGDSTISKTILIYYIYQYLISIVENLGALGWGFPEEITKHFRRLNGKDEDQ